MIDLNYIPYAERQRLERLWRNIYFGAVAINAAIYISGIAIIATLPPWRWIALGTVAMVPPLLQLALTIASPSDGRNEIRFRLLVISVALSVLVTLATLYCFGSDQIRTAYRWIGGVIAVLAPVSLAVYWAGMDDEHRAKRWTILLSAAAVAALAAGAAFGGPIISWICIGIGGAFLLSTLNLPRSDGARGGPPWEPHHLADPYRGSPFPASGYEAEDNAHLVSLLREAQHLLRILTERGDYVRDYHDRYRDFDTLLLALAVMENAGFVGDEFARKARSQANRLTSGAEPTSVAAKNILAEFALEIEYAIARIKADRMGAKSLRLVANP